MAHDEHFLQRLDRVIREHVDFALGLYRDHEAVRHLLRVSNVAGNSDRVALAIADGGQGPHVIVATDGAFVTCLGEGMSPAPWPVIPRTRVDGVLKQLGDQRKRREVAAQIARPGEDDGDLVARISTRKNMLSREELVGISSFVALFADGLFAHVAEISAELHKASYAKASFNKGPRAANHTELHARAAWSAAYGAELCGLAGKGPLAETIERLDGVTTFSMPTTLLVDHTFLLRGIWAAGKIGKSLVPSYRARLEKAANALTIVDAVLALTTIALRHSHTRDDVLRLFRRLADQSPDSREVAVRASVISRATSVITNHEQLGDVARVLGAAAYVRESQRRLAPDDPDRAERASDVPIELAETAYLATHGTMFDTENGLVHLLGACPLLARLSAESFHYPAALLRKLLVPWGAAEVTRHNAQMQSVVAPSEPLRYAARFGRNDPCPCGSGKKLKKCCSP